MPDFVYAVGAVYAVVDCDKSNVVGGESNLHKPACFKMISAETGLVFHDYDSNLSVLDILHHFHVGRSCEVNTAISIINVKLAVTEAVFICVFLKYELLVRDTVGFPLEHILLRESAVEGCY